MKEFDKQKDAPPIAEAAIHKENRVHRILVGALLLVMVVEWIVLLIDKFWLSAFLVTLIIATLLSLVIFRKKMEMEIPAEFHLAAVVVGYRPSHICRFVDGNSRVFAGLFIE